MDSKFKVGDWVKINSKGELAWRRSGTGIIVGTAGCSFDVFFPDWKEGRGHGGNTTDLFGHLFFFSSEIDLIEADIKECL